MADTRRDFLTLSATFGVMVALPSIVHAQAAVDMQKVLLGTVMPIRALGLDNAKITIVEYASLTCSHCATFHNETFPALKEKYIDTGKVRFIFRHFILNPLDAAASILAQSVPADQYFAAIGTFFKTQEQWAFASGDKLENLFSIAKQMGFTREKFEEALKSEELFNRLKKEGEIAAEQFKVEATPTLIVNGLVSSGGKTIDELDKIFEPILKM